MNSLLIALSIAGGVVLAGVVAHGAWTARNATPKMADPEDLNAIPEAMTSSRDNLPVLKDVAIDGDERHIEPSFDPDAFHNDLPVPFEFTANNEKKASLDPLIDVITAIALDETVSGDAVLAALPATRRVGSKPFAVEGLREVTEQWEVPQIGERYSALQAGVQMANRTGALNEIEYSEFVIKVQAFADQVGGTPTFPEMRDEVARARELDIFASNHDAHLRFTIYAVGAAWSTGYVSQQAARLGFVAGALPGRMVLPDQAPNQAPILSLSFDSQAAMSDEEGPPTAIGEVSLSLDVTHVAQEEHAFARMRECARTLADRMEGVICDDQGNQVSEAALDRIAADLNQLYATLDQRDLSAGSQLARRLFS